MKARLFLTIVAFFLFASSAHADRIYILEGRGTGGGGAGNVSSVTAGNGLSDSGTTSDPVLNVNVGNGVTIASDTVQVDSTVCRSNGTNCQPSGTGSGNMTSWRLDADTGTTATILNNTLVSILGGSGISTTISANTISIINDGVLVETDPVWTLDKPLYATLAYVGTLGNWTADKPLYALNSRVDLVNETAQALNSTKAVTGTCSPGFVPQNISNTTYQCVNVTTQIADIYLRKTGDTGTGNYLFSNNVNVSQNLTASLIDAGSATDRVHLLVRGSNSQSASNPVVKIMKSDGTQMLGLGYSGGSAILTAPAGSEGLRINNANGNSLLDIDTRSGGPLALKFWWYATDFQLVDNNSAALRIYNYNTPSQVLMRLDTSTGAQKVIVDGAMNISQNFTVNGKTFFVNSEAHRVGLNTLSPQALLHGSAPAIDGRESIMQFGVNDSPRDGFAVGNAGAANNSFFPTFYGWLESSTAGGALTFVGQTSTTNDTGTTPMLIFNARRYSDGADPLVGPYTDIVTRPLFDFRNRATSVLTVIANGNIGIGTTTPGEKLSVSGNLSTTTEARIGGVASDGTGKAVCVKSDGNLGTCTTAVGAAGTCTCA